ncbi:branched-chain amino acid ABC transporter permease [Inmirania thermothiophila]|nr:branched-chain amino acid ABC transporter permease [Inmirania thermothiophila]
MPRRVLVGLLVVLALAALLPLTGERYYLQLGTKILILGLFAMSLDLLVGFTGLVSLGHAAFFGLGAYGFAVLARDGDPVTLWQALAASLGLAAAAALVIGWISIRTSGVYFIFLTLAFAQMVYYFLFESPRFGGDDGIFIFARPEVTLGGRPLFDLADEAVLYWFVLGIVAAGYALLHTVLQAPFGRVLEGIRENEHRMRAMGYATARYKLAAFVLAGTLAGLAGLLEAIHTEFVNPAYLNWHQSGLLLMMVLLGGMGRLYGALLGAATLVLLESYLPDLSEHWRLPLGGIIIAVVLFLPQGLAGLRLPRRRAADG